MGRGEAAALIALKHGCGMAEADYLCRNLTEEQCTRIVHAGDGQHADQVIRHILSEVAAEIAIERPPTDDTATNTPPATDDAAPQTD